MDDDTNDEPSGLSPLQKQVHPLLIPSVVSTILEHLPLPAVQKCRVVCRDWNREACRSMREQQLECVSLLDDKKMGEYLKLFAPELAPLSLSPHSYYQLYNGVQFAAPATKRELASPPPALDPALPLARFLRAHGTHIRTLVLQQRHPVLLWRDVLWALENHLPVLESLTFRYVPVTPSTDPPPATATALLDQHVNQHQHQQGGLVIFPTIKNLTIGTKSFESSKAARVRAHALALARAQGAAGPVTLEPQRNWRGDADSIQAVLVHMLASMPSLECLSISKLDLEDERAARAPLPLGLGFGGMALALGPLQPSSRAILNVLNQTPAERLTKKLNLLDFPLHVANAETLACIRRILGSGTKTLDIRVEPGPRANFQYLQMTMMAQGMVDLFRVASPQLKCLSLSFPRYDGETWMQLTCSPIPPMPTLRTLKIGVGGIPGVWRRPAAAAAPVWNLVTLHRMATSFNSTLRVLELPGLDDEALRLVYFEFPHLTELAATHGQFTDSGLTGVPLAVCQDPNGVSQDAATGQRLRSSLFIANLTNLRRLRLHSDTMTSLAVRWGIRECRTLEYLELRSEHVDDGMVEVIVDEMRIGGHPLPTLRLRNLNVVGCPAVTRAVKEYAVGRGVGPRLHPHAPLTSHLRIRVPGDGDLDHPDWDDDEDEDAERAQAELKAEHRRRDESAAMPCPRAYYL